MTEVRCPKTIVLLCKRKFIAIVRSDVALAYAQKIGTEEPAQEKSGEEFHLSVSTRSEIDARLFARAPTSNRLDAMRHRAGNYSVFENSQCYARHNFIPPELLSGGNTALPYPESGSVRETGGECPHGGNRQRRFRWIERRI